MLWEVLGKLLGKPGFASVLRKNVEQALVRALPRTPYLWCFSEELVGTSVFNRPLRTQISDLTGALRKAPPFHGSRREKGRYKFRMQAAKWVVANLQGGKIASFCRKMSGRKVTGR